MTSLLLISISRCIQFSNALPKVVFHGMSASLRDIYRLNGLKAIRPIHRLDIYWIYLPIQDLQDIVNKKHTYVLLTVQCIICIADTYVGTSTYEHVTNNFMVFLWTFFAVIGLAAINGGLVNVQE